MEFLKDFWKNLPKETIALTGAFCILIYLAVDLVKKTDIYNPWAMVLYFLAAFCLIILVSHAFFLISVNIIKDSHAKEVKGFEQLSRMNNETLKVQGETAKTQSEAIGTLSSSIATTISMPTERYRKID